MSLRDNNKLVPVSGPEKIPQGLSHTLRNVAGPVAKPVGRAIQALEKAALKAAPGGGSGKVGFIIDATASRSSNWNELQEIQAAMFAGVAGQGAITMRLVHFGGDRITDRGWMRNSGEVAAAMKDVSCVSGSTMIIPSLEMFLDNTPSALSPSIIIVGDSFEENEDEAARVAGKLAARKIKVFTFLDGDDECAGKIFRMLAEKTGGVFAPFGKDMPLDQLCKGVAMMSVGDTDLQSLQNAAVKRLLLTARP